jgi:uncharacterized membrane protein YesL
LKCFVLSVAVTGALFGNFWFYWFRIPIDWLRFVAIVWLYGAAFWLMMHVYLMPLLVHISEPRLLDLYRRSALIALGHPLYALLILVFVLPIGMLSIVFLPAYLLVGGAYVAMVQAHAFREIRRRHGDLALESETEEEISKL